MKMKAFHVWLRPLGDACRVRVEGAANARWLLDRLSQSFVFKTSEPLGETKESSVCSFEIPFNPPLSRTKFEKLLSTIPELTLMTGPE